MARGGKLMIAGVEGLAAVAGGIQIRLSDGRMLTASKVVIAGGAWSKPLAATLGDADPARDRARLQHHAAAGQPSISSASSPSAATASSSRRSRRGIRIGGAVELGGLSLPPNFARADAMLRKAKAFLPESHDRGRHAVDGLPSVDARQPAGDRRLAPLARHRLCLRPRPSRPHPVRRHRPAGGRSADRARAPRSISHPSPRNASERHTNVTPYLLLHRRSYLRQSGPAGGRRRPAAQGRHHDREARRFPRQPRLDPQGPDVRAARPRHHERLDPLSADPRRLRHRHPVHRDLGLPAHVRPRHHRHRHHGHRERADDARRRRAW